jgi:hypothetical protein
MNTSTHTSLETLTDIAEDRLPPEALEAAMTHVATCSACDDTLRRLRHVIGMMRDDTAQDAPRDVLVSVINIFPPGTQSPLRRIVATLVFDSRTAEPAFGMRSLHSVSRQLLYSAQETDVELRITIRNEECMIAGQVIRDSCAGGLIEISGATGTAQASLNELCEFALPPIPTGNYSLRLRMPDVEIEIPELEFKEP